MGHHIVVWDPIGEYWEGSLVDDGLARPLEARGVVHMPVHTELFKRSGVGGFHKRAWGSGWPLDHVVPRLFAPLTLYAIAAVAVPTKLHWRMRLVPEGGGGWDEGAGGREGFVRVTNDGSQHNPHKLSITPGQGDKEVVHMRDLGAPDAWGGWSIGGHTEATAAIDAHYPIAFYGAAPGRRVAWAAVSLG